MFDSDSFRDAHDRLVPGKKAGTLKSRRAGEQQATFISYSLTAIKLKRLTEEQLVYVEDAALAHLYRICQIWQEHLDAVGAPDPKATDVLVDASGTEWVVKKILEHKLLDNVHNCLVLKARG